MTFIATAERSSRPARRRHLSMSIPRPATSALPKSRGYLETRTLHVAQRSKRDSAGASVRTAGADDRIARSRAGVRSENRRGRMPGARRAHQLPGQSLYAGAIGAAGCSVSIPARTSAPGARAARSRPTTRPGRTCAHAARSRPHSHYAHRRTATTRGSILIQAAVLRRQVGAPRRNGTRGGAQLAAIYRDALRTTA